MFRPTITEADAARTDIGPSRSRPEWRERRHYLPFHELSPTEFEIFCFLLLLKEHPQDRIYYYGQTGDRGRDIIHIHDGKVRLIQCKRFESGKVGIPDVREELAKLCIHGFSGKLPETPHAVVFYVVPDVTSEAGDLIRQQSVWRSEAPKALQTFLKREPSPEESAHAHTWWPECDYVAALSLTERARRYTDLVDDFFGVRKVIVGTVADVESAMQRQLQPIANALANLRPLITPVQSEAREPPPMPLNGQILARSFGVASRPLLSWPTTLGSDQWLQRAEMEQISSRITSEDSTTTLLLGLPGSGKSALLAKLGQASADAGITVLALKADQLPTCIDSVGSLSEQLHLPAMITECVQTAAIAGKVLLLIDQLDALADLIDLRPGRLNALLSLVKELSGRPSVHIVCSCRTFEYGHDVRLTSIEAEVTQLAPLAWQTVSDILQEHGVLADKWPTPCKALLTAPQNLKVFLLRLAGTGEEQLFETYQQLYDDLWRKRVLKGDVTADRARLLMDMAERMADRETLWLPLVQFEERETVVTALEAEDILMRSENGRSICFRHQTLFEHARARAFARGNSSLATHVLARQDGLFVRPLLWSSLHYLRGSDVQSYEREMGRLWRETLRKHLRHLLIEFLGQAQSPPPSPVEQVWLLEYLRKPESRTTVLAAIRGNPAWFDLLVATHIPAIMRMPANDAWPMVGILASALPAHQIQCIALLRQEWLPDASKDRLTWNTLEQVTTWDNDVLEIAKIILRRSEIPPSTIMALASAIAEDTPAFAVALVKARLVQELGRLEAVPDLLPPPLPPDATEEQAIVQSLTFDPKERFKRLLDHCQEWHRLPELAELTAGQFVRELWTWYDRLVAHVMETREPRDALYRRDKSLATQMFVERERSNLTEALRAALGEWAKVQPAEFLAFLKAHEQTDSLFVQRLFCRGLRVIAATHPREGLSFLIADPRRFSMGSLDDEHGDSIDLVSAIAAHLNATDIAALEQAIATWQCFSREDFNSEDRRYILRCEREHRLRLLTAIPLEKLSSSTQSLIRTEQQALPAYEQRGVSRVQTYRVVSDMSAEQMGKARDEDVLNFLTLMVQRSGERRHNPFKGGIWEAARAFGQFATTHPDRAARIIERLTAGDHDLPAGDGLRAIAGSGFPPERIIAMAIDLDGRGFRGEDFRVNAAIALGACAKDGVGLPHPACAMLERWLGEPWHDHDAPNEPEDGSKEERVHPLLWQHGGIITLPFGRYHLLQTLTYGYLLRTPPETVRWMNLLEAQVEQSIELQAWRVFSRELENLRLCDPGRAERFLCRLFERYPWVRDSRFGAILVTHAWWYLSQATVSQVLRSMRESAWRDGPQAYGELLAVRRLVFPDDKDTAADLEAVLLADATDTVSRIRTGLAFAAVHLWDDAPRRSAATDILVRLIPQADPRVSHGIMHIFLRTDVLTADSDTERLLRALHRHPSVLNCAYGSFFADRLQDVLSTYPDLVLDLCMDVVALWQPEVGEPRLGFAGTTAQFTNLALTFQRLDGPYRTKGLELFERLLEIGVHDAFATLHELDRRVPNPVAPVHHSNARRRARRISHS